MDAWHGALGCPNNSSHSRKEWSFGSNIQLQPDHVFFGWHSAGNDANKIAVATVPEQSSSRAVGGVTAWERKFPWGVRRASKLTMKWHESSFPLTPICFPKTIVHSSSSSAEPEIEMEMQKQRNHKWTQENLEPSVAGFDRFHQFYWLWLIHIGSEHLSVSYNIRAKQAFGYQLNRSNWLIRFNFKNNTCCIYPKKFVEYMVCNIFFIEINLYSWIIYLKFIIYLI